MKLSQYEIALAMMGIGMACDHKKLDKDVYDALINLLDRFAEEMRKEASE